MMDVDTINTINDEERKMELEGAYSVTHLDDLFELDVEEVFKNILNGKVKVDGFENDPFAAAERFVEEIEDRWIGEDTTWMWDALRTERDNHLALVGYQPIW